MLSILINDNYDCIDESMRETRAFEPAAVFAISRFSKHKTTCRTKIMFQVPYSFHVCKIVQDHEKH